ncbi:ORF6N domain-containing protein [Listeria booriae]|uniref:ORF6N domain-containing protein n=1 Tax=Listeria booriae TaxID=1552123 RepID=A0A842D425_9LIST|nr:ORF6N domain-containing protein [Listeria booriae]MBC2004677.1 ORF6N domain-containing protein [Listeria booriae]
MTNLKVIGKQHLGKFEFTGIEGGFGEGKRAMTVKDIAKIHGKEVKHVNELINRNIKRFHNYIDILDLKVVVQNDHNFIRLTDFGLSNMQISKSPNIYLLSERGYSKLLKILEDDTAWEIYDHLVDNYFSMREQLETSNLSPELQMVSGLFKALANQELATKQLATKVDDMKEILSVNSNEWREKVNSILKRIANNIGGAEPYRSVVNMSYERFESRAHCDLNRRLENRKTKMAAKGLSKTSIQKLNKLDCISEDKRLIEIYLSIVKEMAIQFGINAKELEELKVV